MRRPSLGPISTPRRRQRLLAGAALVVGVAVIVVLVIGTGSPSSPTGSAAAATASGATSVQRRNLVATDTESGTLSYSAPQTVYNRLSGTITWLPSVGQVVKPGGTLFKVDGQPVLLMDGTTPAYRDLTPADSAGADILELNRNLVRLGFNAAGITVDDVWQTGTTYGVELLQESLGETETGSLTLGHVVFLPGNQLISSVDATVGGTGGGGGATGGSTGASTVVDPPAPQFVSLTTTTPPTSTSTTQSSTTPAQTTPPSTPPPGGHPTHHPHPGKHHGSAPTGAASGETLAALSSLLRAEAAQLRAVEAQLQASRNGPGRSGSGGGSGASGGGSAGSGGSGGGAPSGSSGSSNSSNPSSSNSSGGSGGGANATEVLQTTSTRLVVTVDLAASSQTEARVGGHVTVELPNGSTVPGRITAVSPVASASSSGSGGSGGGGSGGGSGSGNGNGNGNGNGSGSSSSTVPVTITLKGHHTGAGLDQASVSVNFVQQKANHVLSVPVTALLATSGGSYDVQEAAAPHHLVPVTTGLFAAGYVQISGPGIYPGLQVTDSQG